MVLATCETKEDRLRVTCLGGLIELDDFQNDRA
jgi:hypothetical protein